MRSDDAHRSRGDGEATIVVVLVETRRDYRRRGGASRRGVSHLHGVHVRGRRARSHPRCSAQGFETRSSVRLGDDGRGVRRRVLGSLAVPRPRHDRVRAASGASIRGAPVRPQQLHHARVRHPSRRRRRGQGTRGEETRGFDGCLGRRVSAASRRRRRRLGVRRAHADDTRLQPRVFHRLRRETVRGRLGMRRGRIPRRVLRPAVRRLYARAGGVKTTHRRVPSRESGGDGGGARRVDETRHGGDIAGREDLVPHCAAQSVGKIRHGRVRRGGARRDDAVVERRRRRRRRRRRGNRVARVDGTNPIDRPDTEADRHGRGCRGEGGARGGGEGERGGG